MCPYRVFPGEESPYRGIGKVSALQLSLNPTEGKGRIPLRVFVYACVRTPARLHIGIPSCDFTIGVVPTCANFTLLSCTTNSDDSRRVEEWDGMRWRQREDSFLGG